MRWRLVALIPFHDKSQNKTSCREWRDFREKGSALVWRSPRFHAPCFHWHQQTWSELSPWADQRLRRKCSKFYFTLAQQSTLVDTKSGWACVKNHHIIYYTPLSTWPAAPSVCLGWNDPWYFKESDIPLYLIIISSPRQNGTYASYVQGMRDTDIT